MRPQKTFGLTSSIFFLMVNTAASSSALEVPSVKLEKTVHFLSPGGDVTLVKPGTYETEVTEEWLRLIPQGDERNQAILLAAQAVTHTETLKAPRALSIGGEQDVHMVALFLPDGSGLWAMGSYSGIRSRSVQGARQADLLFLQKRIEAIHQQIKLVELQRKQLERSRVNESLKQIESMQEQVRNKRQMATTTFQNFDQKANQLYNLLSSIMKTMNEMRMGTVRNMF
jgi:hypothetical protein